VNIYFSCSITGGRQDQQVYESLVQALLQGGHVVPTAILASPSLSDLGSEISPGEVYRRDMAWLEGCEAVVAEVSTPSHGVGYEIAAALAMGKPVLCCYQAGRRVSKMLTGNDHPRLRVMAYTTAEEAVRGVREYLDFLRLNCE
jgi:nucleoside 2-deoxyribosyltransferase